MVHFIIKFMGKELGVVYALVEVPVMWELLLRPLIGALAEPMLVTLLA